MEINKMYMEVFKDCVNCYLDNMEEEDKIKISEKEIEKIANKIIYKNDYVWEVIDETINMYIGDILLEKEKENIENE